jgi:choline dehydrogenase-like flavoprotein
VSPDHDVVVVGAGGDGPVAAWRLAEAGLDVLVLEAGPWHGNENWPNPHAGPGEAKASSSPDDLSGALLDEQFTKRTLDMGPFVGKLRWGPADRSRPRWPRKPPQDGDIFQVAGVGGTTLHYLGNHPRAFPAAIDEQGHWPIDYADLVPYYQTNERLLDVGPAPTTPKEDLFFQGAEARDWPLLDVKNVTDAGYRPQPNAIRQPDGALRNEQYDGDFRYPEVTGSTLSGFDMQGNPHPLGAPVEEKAKRASNVSYVPMALQTGNVTIRPNAFVTDVLTESPLGDTPVATGVEFRDTWSGQTQEVTGEVVCLAAGAIETPRLWLNSDLPDHEWLGRGLTIHHPDAVVGTWEPDELRDRLGQPTLDPHVGQDSAARFDSPGLGSLQIAGLTPAIGSVIEYAGSQAGYAFQNEVDPDEPWDARGRVVGPELKERMADYRRSMVLLILTDDHPHEHNRVEVSPSQTDEHGPTPQVFYDASDEDDRKRDELSRIGAEILRGAGASHVHRVDFPPAPLHIHSTMRIGEVTDAACEARDVDRLFVTDHSVLGNSLGGPNPTNTGQALAMRTADKIVGRYFADR